MLSPEFTWSKKFIEAVSHYCKWQLKRVHHKQLLDDTTDLRKATAALTQLIQTLDGGPKKSMAKATKERTKRRRSIDSARIKLFPATEQMKNAVRKAMATLKVITDAYANTPAEEVQEGSVLQLAILIPFRLDAVANQFQALSAGKCETHVILFRVPSQMSDC